MEKSSSSLLAKATVSGPFVFVNEINHERTPMVNAGKTNYHQVSFSPLVVVHPNSNCVLVLISSLFVWTVSSVSEVS